VYAIVQAGGRQVRVDPGRIVTVDHLDRNAGDEVTFDRVLFVGDDAGMFAAGSPYVAGARVVGVVAAQTQGPKIKVFHKKRRKGMRKRTGHRAVLTRVRITDIVTG
jgi:large subunit ribosomal protein L21